MPGSFSLLSCRALLERAASHTTHALAASDYRARVVHCELSQRYTLQALAILQGPCGTTIPRRLPTPEAPRLNRTPVLP